MPSLRTATMALALILAAPIAGAITFDLANHEAAREIRRNSYASHKDGELFFYTSEAEAYKAAIQIYP